MNRDPIKQAVTEHYAARARAVSALPEADVIPLESVGKDEACCGPSEMTEEEMRYVRGIYSQTEVAGLPDGAIDAAAGCGNPTAIAEVSPGEVILDLGSGGGIDCFLAARQTGPAGRVIGVDMTPEMVELARRNAIELGATNVEFRHGEIENLPVDDGTIDLIISNCVVNLSTDKAAVFAEAFRVLKPGGRFRVSDMVWRTDRPEGADSVEEWAGCIAGALPLADFLDGLREAGFMNARADALRELPSYEGLVSALISAEKAGA